MSDYIASHRSTTSSRRPGVAIEGTVRVMKATLVICLDCGGRWFGPGVHAAHFNGAGVKVDCVGRLLK